MIIENLRVFCYKNLLVLKSCLGSSTLVWESQVNININININLQSTPIYHIYFIYISYIFYTYVIISLSKHTHTQEAIHTQKRGKRKHYLLTDKVYSLKNVAMVKLRLLNILDQCDNDPYNVLWIQTSHQVSCTEDLTERQKMGKRSSVVTDL